MKLQRSCLWVLPLLVLPLLAVSARADTAVLGNTGSTFAVLGASEVTNINTTTINGNVGSSPTYTLTGTGGCPGVIGCIVFTGGGIASLATSSSAQADLTTAITTLDLLNGSSLNIGTGGLSGSVLVTPGVYSSPSTFLLNGTVTLDAGGLSNVDFIFLMGSSLTADVGSKVVMQNFGSNVGVYWVEGAGSATLNGSNFVGYDLAGASITMGSAVTISCGGVLASTGLVSMIGDTINTGCNGGFINSSGMVVTTSGGTSPGPGGPPVNTPEPATLPLLGTGFAGLLGLAGMKKVRARRASPALA